MTRNRSFLFATLISTLTWAAPAGEVVESYFGTPVRDTFRWLEDGNSKEVQEWALAQDAQATQYLSQLPNRTALEKRLKELIYVDSVSVPVERNGRLFYSRSISTKERPILFWRKGEDGEEHLLLDPELLSTEGNLSVGDWAPSPDGVYIAYQLKKHNADESTLHVRHVATGREDPMNVIPGANFADVSWSPDGAGFYYMRLPTDANIPPVDRVAHADIRYHRLGQESALDPQIYPKTGNASLYLSPTLSHDGKWLFISILNGWASNDIYFRKEGKPAGIFQPLFISTYTTATATAWKGQFYLFTNDSAPRSRIVEVSPNDPDPKLWKTIIPERPDVTIIDCRLIGGFFFLKTVKNAAAQLEVRDLRGELQRTIDLPAMGDTDALSGSEDTDQAFFDFESFTLPRRIYRTSVSSGKTFVWSKTNVLVDPAPYKVEQVWYRSKDKTLISMFIVRKRDMPMDRSVPFLLEGYGGFNTPILPRFNPALYPWLEAGGGYAIPNLRGGGEYGETWHQAGMLTRKQNTFDDFIAAADYLISSGYTNKDRLVIQGSSNGGLLVGAALTQRPDLFKAAVCTVPLLDMIRYPLFGEGPAWVQEYGSPKDEEQFRALWAYSPYHRVQKGVAYPRTLFISASHDDRVDPMHARKMTAALQAATSAKNPILLRTRQNASHTGSGMKKTLLENYVDQISFMTAP